MTGPEFVVEAIGLTKRYGEVVALDGFDLAVRPGTVHGLLGPNGAGKTTAVRILTTLARMDRGEARVAGHDVRTEQRLVKRRIGLASQQTTVDDVLTARQNLTMFGRLFRLDKTSAQRRADELLAQFGLEKAAARPPKEFSGGMRRRLDLAASMILAPDVLFLDEPTTGLDPAGRREVWQAVRDLTATGTTVLLTTHYLDEADHLCDRVSVIDHGRNLVDDSPSGLKRQIGNEQLEIVAAEPDDLDRLVKLGERAVGDLGEVVVDRQSATLTFPVADGVETLTDLVAEVRDIGIPLADIGLRRPTLDEAFLQLTSDTTRSTKERV